MIESSGSVKQSLLCNFLSVRIGQAVGCWWAQHANLTSIICLFDSEAAVCRTHSSMTALLNQSARPACFYPLILAKQVCLHAVREDISHETGHFPDSAFHYLSVFPISNSRYRNHKRPGTSCPCKTENKVSLLCFSSLLFLLFFTSMVISIVFNKN